jgi:hypothetical protein
MNEVAVKGLLKVIKSVIPPETIKEAANSLIKSAIDYKNEVELKQENGEVNITAIAYEIEGVAYCGLGILNCQNHIVRFSHIQEVDQLIDNLIQKI